MKLNFGHVQLTIGPGQACQVQYHATKPMIDAALKEAHRLGISKSDVAKLLAAANCG